VRLSRQAYRRWSNGSRCDVRFGPMVLKKAS
jgi:hypothetical protein